MVSDYLRIILKLLAHFFESRFGFEFSYRQLLICKLQNIPSWIFTHDKSLVLSKWSNNSCKLEVICWSRLDNYIDTFLDKLFTVNAVLFLMLRLNSKISPLLNLSIRSLFASSTKVSRYEWPLISSHDFGRLFRIITVSSKIWPAFSWFLNI